MSSKPIKPSDTILGYSLVERIGSGGYGEVWSAIAPGGLQKAVKFVYGYHDEKRAQTEIKALDRVKELRHPFLLSLERIDIVDGQLVIISELADGCLANVFNSYIAKGEPGIPREELLRYIRDAGDALDYLAQTHSLQHLDVKPENLLIVGGHVKVADFGLVKELDVSAQSLMTGMTPAYAAPELFDGQPGDRSDQYSLAIVYQEMLTSLRPFPGTTPAQLAAQHMHGRPNLRNLPKGDQPVIAKALSKDPAVRYNSCREMVDELSNKKMRKKTIRRMEILRKDEDTDSQTIIAGEATRDMTAIVSSGSLPFQAVELEKLGPPDLSDKETELQPTIVVAVGKMASQTAAKFKQRLTARHGSTDELPSVKIVCIDTDRQAMSDLALNRGDCKMDESELLPTPLRKPEVYRDRLSSHLNWLSRRWIYNIPRSLQTEGLRPLGRLAFADHFDSICRRLTDAIESITKEENLSETSDTVGISPANKIQPRVFIVGSISGGASGMLLDLAYTIKTLLIESGFDSNFVHAIMMHSVNRRSREPGLAAANSFAFLTELRHYTEYGYPGDDSLGLPEFMEEPPLDDLYYLDLGADLPSTKLDEKLNSIAEWVYLNSLTNCAKFFDGCREMTRESDHFDLRTFGLSISGQGKSNAGLKQADDLAVSMIQNWIEGTECEREAAAAEAREFCDDVEFHSDGVINLLDEELQQLIPNDQFDHLLAQSKELIQSDDEDPVQRVVDHYDSIFGIRPADQQVGYVAPELVGKFEEMVAHFALPLGENISDVVSKKLETKRLNLAIPFGFLNECLNRLDQLKNKWDDASRGCDNKLNELLSVMRELVTQPKRQNKTDAAALLNQCLESYRLFRWQDFLIRNSRVYGSVVRSSIVASKSVFDKYRELLVSLKSQFHDSQVSPDLQDSIGFNLGQIMLDEVRRSKQKLIERMEIQLFEDEIQPQGGFQEFLTESYKVLSDFPSQIRETAIQIVTDTYKKLSIDELIASNQVPPADICEWLNCQLNAALPDVRNCGGGARLIAAFPQFSGESNLPSLLNQQFGAQAVGVNGTAGDFVLCFEGEGVSLPGVAFRLLELRPDAAELSKRIHCRKDVQWSTLNDLL